MSRRLRLARALFTLGFAEAVQYRAEIFIWMLTYTLPLIMMFVWIGLAQSGGVPGYDAESFVRYFMLVFLVRQMTPAWIAWMLAPEIRLGDLSPKLLRPLDPYWLYIAQHWSALALRVPVVVAISIAGLWLGGALGSLDPARIPLFLFAVFGGWLVYFHMNYCVGLVAFWTDQALGIMNVLFSVHMILGGAMAPLDLFPPAVQAVLPFTPFPYALNFPVQVMSGALDGAALWQGFAVQWIWAAAFIGLRYLLWTRGLRRYAAAGA